MYQFCTNFWIEARAKHLVISKAALRVLIPFATSYMCDAGFSAVAVKKQNIARNLMLNGKCALRFQALHYDLRRFAATKELICRIKLNYITLCETFVLQ